VCVASELVQANRKPQKDQTSIIMAATTAVAVPRLERVGKAWKVVSPHPLSVGNPCTYAHACMPLCLRQSLWACVSACAQCACPAGARSTKISSLT
jgi:hypothetical protein